MIVLMAALGCPVAGQTTANGECLLRDPQAVAAVEVRPHVKDWRGKKKANVDWADIEFTLHRHRMQIAPGKKIRLAMRDEKTILNGDFFEKNIYERNGNTEVLRSSGIAEVRIGALREGHSYYLVGCYPDSSRPVVVSNEFSFMLLDRPVRSNGTNRTTTVGQNAVVKVTTSLGTGTGFFMRSKGRLKGHLLAPAQLFAHAKAKEAQVFFHGMEDRPVRYLAVNGCSQPIKKHLCQLELHPSEKTKPTPDSLEISPQQDLPDGPVTVVDFKESTKLQLDARNLRCDPEKIGSPLLGKSGVVAVYACEQGNVRPVRIAQDRQNQSQVPP